MKPIRFPGFDIVLGAPKDWNEARLGPCAGLPVRRTRNGLCQSVWKPTLRERLRFLFGGKIILSVHSGRSQPPVSLAVGFIPEARRKGYEQERPMRNVETKI